MNEKDRRIVTFGGDDDIASEYENISMDFDIPEETPASSGTYNAPETDSHNDAAEIMVANTGNFIGAFYHKKLL